MCSALAPKPVSKRARRDSDSEDSDPEKPPEHAPLLDSGKKRDPIDLRAAIENDAAECERKGLSSWKLSHAGSSSLPARHLCVICGFFGSYKCMECASKRIAELRTYVCGPRCLEVHKDQSCGRPLNLTHW
ncbi:hypothetical protein BBBOND_0200930 [Babesia bigemina]|uniref:Uncharacterized protein n=1 Tax=Babesia bigemina TaxID=5866 RepID=A0A061D2E4_BABBI|nr:hypothetical protein BBBOND_0200930 [Babesia bigemina]CDR94936.1 hypothetical protein BBBOND_0200930 [Babesia bigemina]|eukprot:XP_012767122.1 hypothetical protein BBBOND_0200930 [Babesia bigemina]